MKYGHSTQMKRSISKIMEVTMILYMKILQLNEKRKAGFKEQMKTMPEKKETQLSYIVKRPNFLNVSHEIMVKVPNYQP